MATYIIAKCIRRESNPVWSFVMNYSGRLSGSFHFWRAPIAPGYRHSNPLRRLLRLAVERVYPYPLRMQVGRPFRPATRLVPAGVPLTLSDRLAHDPGEAAGDLLFTGSRAVVGQPVGLIRWSTPSLRKPPSCRSLAIRRAGEALSGEHRKPSTLGFAENLPGWSLPSERSLRGLLSTLLRSPLR